MRSVTADRTTGRTVLVILETTFVFVDRSETGSLLGNVTLLPGRVCSELRTTAATGKVATAAQTASETARTAVVSTLLEARRTAADQLLTTGIDRFDTLFRKTGSHVQAAAACLVAATELLLMLRAAAVTSLTQSSLSHVTVSVPDATS